MAEAGWLLEGTAAEAGWLLEGTVAEAGWLLEGTVAEAGWLLEGTAAEAGWLAHLMEAGGGAGGEALGWVYLEAPVLPLAQNLHLTAGHPPLEVQVWVLCHSSDSGQSQQLSTWHTSAWSLPTLGKGPH